MKNLIPLLFLLVCRGVYAQVVQYNINDYKVTCSSMYTVNRTLTVYYDDGYFTFDGGNGETVKRKWEKISRPDERTVEIIFKNSYSPNGKNNKDSLLLRISESKDTDLGIILTTNISNPLCILRQYFRPSENTIIKQKKIKNKKK
ncbi:MAG TPA: hypothetical protein PLT92_10945 [Ignavibacteriaceae bacterium]|nr:hypothetical protein [Ignavibacteriaceae bacterium]HPO54499.1 hypothetical protein [Ignavibacteriaceae bacterium]